MATQVLEVRCYPGTEKVYMVSRGGTTGNSDPTGYVPQNIVGNVGFITVQSLTGKWKALASDIVNPTATTLFDLTDEDKTFYLDDVAPVDVAAIGGNAVVAADPVNFDIIQAVLGNKVIATDNADDTVTLQFRNAADTEIVHTVVVVRSTGGRVVV